MASLLYNPYQVALLDARRLRVCESCQHQFTPASLTASCPLCQATKLRRAFDRLVLIAGRRGGKTLIGALAALEELQVPYSTGWACAPTYPKLHDFVMPAIRQLIPEDWFTSGFAKESVEHKEIRFHNGALLQFRSLDDPNAGRGPGLDWAWLDEVCEIAEAAWDNLRPALTERRGVAIFTTSPQGFDWVYERLWMPATQGVPGHWACRYKTSDNPIIDPRELAKARHEMSATKYQQEYEADFVTFEGAVYQLPSHLILKTDEAVREFLPEWPKIDPDRASIVGLDPGGKHPFAAVWLIKTERALVAVWEYNESMRSARQHAKAILDITSRHHPRYVIDRTQLQTQIELAQYGLSAAQVQAGRTSVMASIDRVKAWLEQGQLVFVESAVPRLIRQLQSYRYADTDKRSGEKGQEAVYKANDDLCDALRYAVMSWPSLPKPPEIVRPLGRNLQTDPVPESMQATFARLARLHTRDDGLLPVHEHPVGNMGAVGRSDEDSDDSLTHMGAFWG